MSAMSPEPILPEPDAADRRRRWWIVSAAVLLPAILMLIFSTGQPAWGYAVIALVFPALWIAGQRHNARTRESTDERAQHIHRRAATFSWQVVAVLLSAILIWMDLRHGTRSAEPYAALATVLVASYVVPRLWWQWRDH